MLFLKAFSCMVICFGIVQTKCIQNILLEKMLKSNISNSEKLEEVNKIVLNGLLHQENSEGSSSNKQIRPDPIRNPVFLQLPDTPTSELWNPWTNLENIERKPDNRRKVRPVISWNPWTSVLKERTFGGRNKVKPSVAWNPWNSIRIRQINSEPTGYQLPSWNPFDPPESQLNSYQNSYPSQINDERLSLLNLQRSINNNDRSTPYHDDHQPDMDTAGSYSLYSSQFQSPVSSENNPSMLENNPFQ